MVDYFYKNDYSPRLSNWVYLILLIVIIIITLKDNVIGLLPWDFTIGRLDYLLNYMWILLLTHLT